MLLGDVRSELDETRVERLVRPDTIDPKWVFDSDWFCQIREQVECLLALQVAT